MDAKRNQAAEARPESPARSRLDELLTRPLLDASAAPGQNREAASSIALGRIHSVTAEGEVFVVVSMLGEEPVRALSLCALSGEDAGRACAVQFVGGDKAHPCVLGCLIGGEAQGGAQELQADGQRLVIQADQEIELRCGESVIIMKRNGVIEIRGNYVTSQATATQRIRGGSVHVN